MHIIEIVIVIIIKEECMLTLLKNVFGSRVPKVLILLYGSARKASYCFYIKKKIVQTTLDLRV